MTYTHCRGCGVELDAGPCSQDGLCIGERPADEDPYDGGCTAKCQEWHEKKDRQRIKFAGWWLSPEWAVSIDQWLEATR